MEDRFLRELIAIFCIPYRKLVFLLFFYVNYSSCLVAYLPTINFLV
jgi:hypothetical protein